MLTSALLVLFIMAHWYVAWWAFKNDDRELHEQTGWLRMAAPKGLKAAPYGVMDDEKEPKAQRDVKEVTATAEKRQQPSRQRSKKAHRRDEAHISPGGRRRGL